MRSHAEQAEILIRAVWDQTRQLKQSGLPFNRALEAVKPGIAGLLAEFQDELLESQRQAALALEEALGRK